MCKGREGCEDCKGCDGREDRAREAALNGESDYEGPVAPAGWRFV